MQTVPTSSSGWPSDFHQQSDAVRIQQCMQEDKAQTVLLERYGRLIYSIAWKLELSPEEVAMAICLAIIEKLSALQYAPNLSAWLTAITVERCFPIRDLERANLDPLMREENGQILEQERLVWQALSMMDRLGRGLLTPILCKKEASLHDNMARDPRRAIYDIKPEVDRCLRTL